MLLASAVARPTIEGAVGERPVSGASNSMLSFAKSDDDGGFPAHIADRAPPS